MNLNTFRQLFTLSGRAALADAMALSPREVDFLADFQVLSRKHNRELARVALEIAVLRGEAGAKFPEAERLFFTRAALEQATARPVAAYRAGRFRGFSFLADLGCSVGGDTLALAQEAPVLGIDRDPLRLAMARANLLAAGAGARARFVRADLAGPLPLAPSPGMALFCDPSRRTGERRLYSVREYRPALSTIHGWTARHPALAVKISPGVQLAELSAYDAELEFVSWKGELKEAVLWFGPLNTASRRATVLPGPHTLTGPATGVLEPSLAEPQQFIYEPDPSVLRAGLVRSLGRQLGAAQLDPDIAYLTGAQRVDTPFARVWEIEDWLPFGVKQLRRYLRARKVGRVVVKKRGSPLTPEELIHQLKLNGERERVLFLTHLQGRPIVVVAYPEPPPQETGE